MSVLETGIQNVADTLTCKVRKNPSELSGAVKSYIKHFCDFKKLILTFGKYTGVAESLTSQRKPNSRCLRNKHGKIIKVQPTVLSRR